MKRFIIGLAFIVLCFGWPPAAKVQENVALLGASPAMDFSRELLKRADVQNELGIDANQREALARAIGKSGTTIVIHPVVQLRNSSRLSAEETNQLSAEFGREAAKQTAYIMNERRRELDEILRPDQRER